MTAVTPEQAYFALLAIITVFVIFLATMRVVDFLRGKNLS